MFDIIAVSPNGETLPIQVKTIRGGAWQFKVTQFVKIEMDGDKQHILGKVEPPNPDLIFVFVYLSTNEFYILTQQQLHDLAYNDYVTWLKANNYVRPRTPTSFHLGITPDKLVPFKNNWQLIERRTK